MLRDLLQGFGKYNMPSLRDRLKREQYVSVTSDNNDTLPGI